MRSRPQINGHHHPATGHPAAGRTGADAEEFGKAPGAADRLACSLRGSAYTRSRVRRARRQERGHRRTARACQRPQQGHPDRHLLRVLPLDPVPEYPASLQRIAGARVYQCKGSLHRSEFRDGLGRQGLPGCQRPIEKRWRGLRPHSVTFAVSFYRADRAPASSGANSNPQRECRSRSSKFFAARPGPSQNCPQLLPWQSGPAQLLGDLVRTMP